MGTGGPNPGASFVRGLASFIGSIRGKKRKSNFLHVIVFCTYGKGFEGRTLFEHFDLHLRAGDRVAIIPIMVSSLPYRACMIL